MIVEIQKNAQGEKSYYQHRATKPSTKSGESNSDKLKFLLLELTVITQ